MFQQAAECAGVDAWRRIIRIIDNGRDVRFEQLRNEVRMLWTYSIKHLEGVAVGVASFENKIKEYVEAA